MNEEKKNLYGFGYGCALLIPFIVTLHSLEHGLKWWVVIGLFVFLLFVVTKMVLVKPVWNSWVTLVQLCVFIFGIKQGFSSLSLFFLGLSIVIFGMAMIRVEWLKPVYTQVMKAAHLIGTVITGLILSVMFYCVFGVVGIVLRVLKKDLLDQRINTVADSYWIKREKIDFNKSHYTRQF